MSQGAIEEEHRAAEPGAKHLTSEPASLLAALSAAAALLFAPFATGIAVQSLMRRCFSVVPVPRC